MTDQFSTEIDSDKDLIIYKKDALSVVTFKIVYEEEDLNDSQLKENRLSFKPDMAHQIFGETESIFGYSSLSINLYYTHNSSNCFVEILSDGKIKNSKMYKADDIMQSLEPWLPENFVTNKSDFLNFIKTENHEKCFGTVLKEFTSNEELAFLGKNVVPNYKINLCDINDEEFKKYHQRFETFIVWFIDAANFIDLDDEKWMIFYVYEEFNHPITSKLIRSPVGFCSVYKFFNYPNNIRARISQFFILPSHQKRGIGSKFFKTVVDKIKEMPEVVDITVEEPTPVFQKIRDIYDCERIYSELKNEDLQLTKNNQKKIYQLMKEQKICKRQCQRVFDVLGCSIALKNSTADYNRFILDIKKRITADIERETRGSKRLCNLERAGVFAEPIDKNTNIEAEYKRYLEDIEPSVKYFQMHPKCFV